MSGSSFVGFAAAGYSTGVNVYNYEWMATVVLIFAALFVFPLYIRSRVFTMPEFLERRLDRRSRYAFSGFTIIAYLFVDAAGALYAGAVVIQTIYPDLPLWVIVVGLAIVAGGCDERAQVRIGRIATVVFTILAVIWAPQIQNFPNIVTYFRSFLSYLTPPVIVTFLMGIFWKRATSAAAFWTIAIGVPVGVALWIGNEIIYQDGGPQFLIACGMLCALWAVVFWAVSTATEVTHENVDELTFSWDVWRQETEELAGKPWYRNYRTLAAMLGVATVLFVLPWIPGVPNPFVG